MVQALVYESRMLGFEPMAHDLTTLCVGLLGVIVASHSPILAPVLLFKIITEASAVAGEVDVGTDASKPED